MAKALKTATAVKTAPVSPEVANENDAAAAAAAAEAAAQAKAKAEAEAEAAALAKAKADAEAAAKPKLPAFKLLPAQGRMGSRGIDKPAPSQVMEWYPDFRGSAIISMMNEGMTYFRAVKRTQRYIKEGRLIAG
jgi:hypothetical protein